MKPHVDFLGVLFVVWGLLTVVVGLSTLALGVGAVSLIASASRSGGQVAAGITAAAFMTLAFIAIVWGAAHILVGLPLKRRTPASRLWALMLGSVDLLLLPYGTALGIYALYVLLREDGKINDFAWGYSGLRAATVSQEGHATRSSNWRNSRSLPSTGHSPPTTP